MDNWKHQNKRQPDDRRKSQGAAKSFSNLKTIMGEHFNDILKQRKKNVTRYINQVKKYVQDVAQHVSSHQLRNIYGHIVSLDYNDDNVASKLQMVRPKLMYAAGRASSSGGKEKNSTKRVMEDIEKLISQIKSQEEAREFKNFMESLVAYHKYFSSFK